MVCSVVGRKDRGRQTIQDVFTLEAETEHDAGWRMGEYVCIREGREMDGGSVNGYCLLASV